MPSRGPLSVRPLAALFADLRFHDVGRSMVDMRLTRRLTVASLALASLMALPSLAFATTLVVFAGDDFLVIATASLATTVGSRGTDSACNIYDAGDVFFGLSGGDSLGPDLAQVIGEELRYGQGTVEERVLRAGQAARASLLDEIGRHLRLDRGRGHREISDLQNGVVLDGFAATMLNGRPALWQLELRAIYDGGYFHVVPKTTRIQPAAHDRLWFDTFHNSELIDVAVERFEARAAADRRVLIAGAKDLVQLDLDLDAKMTPHLQGLKAEIAVAVIDNSGGHLVAGPCASAWGDAFWRP